MNIPNNEGKACDAVIRYLEKLSGQKRAEIRYPEIDNVGPPVDLRFKLGGCEYAIEHTRIESFEKQIQDDVAFKQIYEYIGKQISDSLPGPAYYELHVPTGLSLPEKRKKCKQTLDNLVDWIRTSACCMHEGNISQIDQTRSPVWAEDSIKGIPPGFECEMELMRWPDANLIRRKPGFITMRLICPENDDLKYLRMTRLRRAFSEKCPKLGHCKDEGARTVLILESVESVLTRFDHIGHHLPDLLTERTDAPDEIYLVETDKFGWWVYPIKRDGDHWPTVGMPAWGGTIYEEDKLPTAFLPAWYTKAFGLDKLYKPHPRGWVPATFDPEELEDLTPRRGSKK